MLSERNSTTYSDDVAEFCSGISGKPVFKSKRATNVAQLQSCQNHQSSQSTMTFRARDKSIRLLLDVRQLQVQLAFQSIMSIFVVRSGSKVMRSGVLTFVEVKTKFCFFSKLTHMKVNLLF